MQREVTTSSCSKTVFLPRSKDYSLLTQVPPTGVVMQVVEEEEDTPEIRNRRTMATIAIT
jgi:hypothetical protein